MSNTDLQTLAINSPIVELWEIELASTYAYFHSGLNESLTEVQFRNRTNPSTINVYAALPIQAEGFSVKSDGALARPTITFANILSTFSDALGGFTNEDLLGKKIYRRRTFYKYTVGQPEDSNPPIEFPIQMYYFDRIASKTRSFVSFELAAAFDIAGVEIPRRTIIGNGCSWKYQGAAPELIATDRVGGCNWSRHSLISINGTEYRAYYNKKGEQVVPLAAVDTVTNPVSGVTQNFIYRTTETSTIQKINADGTLSASGTLYNYWQATRTTSSPGTPSNTNSAFRRVRVYSPTYSSAAEYAAYTNPDYNQYVVYTLAGEITPRLWQVKKHTQAANSHDTTPRQNAYWKLGDECSKTLDACARRFNHNPATVTGSEVVGAAVKRSSETLPFGGFPGSRIF